MSPRVRLLAAVAAIGLLLAGCSPATDPVSSPTPTAASPTGSVAPSTSPSASASPSTTLPAEKQQALQEAADAALAYRQIAVDLYSGARTSINDLAEVTTGDVRVSAENTIALELAKGYRDTPRGAKLTIITVEPLKVDLKEEPPIVVVRVCLDATAVTTVKPDGSTTPGTREQLDYHVAKTDFGWAVKKVMGEPNAKDRAC